MCLPHREALYGGAAGGGKSVALLLAALQYVDVPGYAALLLRRKYTDLTLPKALIPLSHEILAGTDATWNGQEKQWKFPSGATVTFGYLDHEDDKYRYQGAAFQFVGWDELTQFTETQYRYLFSRQRKLADSKVPVRVRATSNPGGRGHDWVKRRFLIERKPTRIFVPAKLEDNPTLDADDYIESLEELDPITRKQLLEGDWTARAPGGLFRREWFGPPVPRSQVPKGATWLRHWDLAATEPSIANPDPDWTSGCLMAELGGEFWIADVKRKRLRPHGVDQLLETTAHEDGYEVQVSIEQEPGSAGKLLIDGYRRGPLKGYTVIAEKVSGDKASRARPFSSACEAGHVHLCEGPWLGDFLDELESFTGEDGEGHDDQTDSASGAHARLARMRKHGSVRIETGSLSRPSPWKGI
jgi:predicted phage terminase large subunit-like protein